MRARRATTFLALLFLTFSTIAAAAADPTDQQRAVLQSLHFRTGKILIANGAAALNTGADYRYLDANDALTFLTKLEGNAPSAAQGVEGVLLPTDSSETWFAVLFYSTDGHVKDNDAAGINYDDLLKTMQQQADEQARKERDAGYAGAHLLGWAQRPYYDSKTKKLYWARSLQFDNQKTATLNYDVRVLGRTGYVNVKIVDSVDQLPAINARMPQILSMINFTPGNTYADFNSSTDRIAEYGIAGLIAGGVLAKMGLLKWLFVSLAAFWKVIAATVVAGFAAVSRFFGKLFGRKQAS